jgi:hypothetical protein
MATAPMANVPSAIAPKANAPIACTRVLGRRVWREGESVASLVKLTGGLTPVGAQTGDVIGRCSYARMGTVCNTYASA